ncbi:uncharacterized protein LMH87_008473 [Akanthomyces muscarius]|uniref:Polysaccharide lyase n=1 Tax=Akanthomyces muscarius TaxID=2231603 RepID=A0A9W8QGX7_AKAMU|nr:uncharacterized protein LMH87_008473 [Akanthomyces muscarius]KAJ4157917.1 hypothetical protein LMH87_008473 [Akanthomyces muscarius]
MKLTRIIPAITFSALSAYASAEAVFKVNYEDQSVSSGYPTSGSERVLVPGIEPDLATAKDAVYIVPGGAHNTEFAVANKVTLDDPAYVGGGFPRSEFGFAGFPGAIYKDGERGEYTFSMLLKDLEPSVKGDRPEPAEDVVWQFKHHGGGHDLHLALVGKNLKLGWGGNVYKETIIEDVTPHVNKWMDFRFNVLWKSDETGNFTLDFKLPGECKWGHTVTKNDLQTYVTASPDGTPWTGTGSIQYGVYRHSANSSAGDTKTLIVYHDEVTAINFSNTADL